MYTEGTSHSSSRVTGVAVGRVSIQGTKWYSTPQDPPVSVNTTLL